jgi:hypothetical protein
MSVAVYPKGIVAWADRVDLVNIVYANDPNTLAAEIGGIEKTLGVMPHVESAPIYGSPLTYSNVAARIHDVQVGTQEPICTLQNSSFSVPNSAPTGTFNAYNILDDPFKWYNGTDITIQSDGWYSLSANQTVSWWSSGYMHLVLYVGGTWVADDHWTWDFPENAANGRWKGRDHVMSVGWQGIVHAGQRIQVKTENGTGKDHITCYGAYLRAKYDRQVSHTQRG